MEPGLLDGLRLAAAFLMVGGAAASDLRTRRVPNRWWLPFACAAALFLAADLAWRDPGDVGLAAAGAALLAGVFYLFWRLGLFGGADAKGLMVLAALLPWPRAADPLPLPPAPGALVDACLLVALLPVGLALWNLGHGRAAFPALLLGVPMPLERARAAHVWPMQRLDAEGRLRWRWWQRAGQELDPLYDALREAGHREVWATPKVPFMAFLAAALAIDAAWGNLVLRLVVVATGAP